MWLDLISWPMSHLSCCSCARMSTGHGWGLASLSVQPLCLSVTHTCLCLYILSHAHTHTYKHIHTSLAHTRTDTHTHTHTVQWTHTCLHTLTVHNLDAFPACVITIEKQIVYSPYFRPSVWIETAETSLNKPRASYTIPIVMLRCMDWGGGRSSRCVSDHEWQRDLCQKTGESAAVTVGGGAVERRRVPL